MESSEVPERGRGLLRSRRGVLHALRGARAFAGAFGDVANLPKRPRGLRVSEDLTAQPSPGLTWWRSCPRQAGVTLIVGEGYPIYRGGR